MQEYEAGILRTEFRGNNTYIIDLSCEAFAHEVVPGQFVHIRTGCGTDPFLRRAISVFEAAPERGEIKLMIEVVGQGTEMLCSMRRGSTVNIIGPLGKGFDLHLGGNETCVLVGGGIGAAPLVFLARKLKEFVKIPVIFMIGARC